MTFIILLSALLLLTLFFIITVRQMERGISNLKSAKKNNTPLSISVIVSCRNEEQNLPGLISALEKQNTQNLSVDYILVNDRSEDNSYQIINNQTEKNSLFNAIHISERVAGFAPKKRAIDLAIQQAKGDFIVLTDADGRPGELWLQTLANYFRNGSDMVLGYAPYFADAESHPIKKILALEYFSQAAVAAAFTGLAFPLTCVGTNMAYRKSVYTQIGGFGEFKAFISGDDDLFLTRVRDKGNFKIDYCIEPQGHVYNAPPGSIGQFFNQRVRYASKGLVYPAKVTAGLGTYVLFNFMLIVTLITGMFTDALLLPAFAVVFIFKMFLEYKFTLKTAKKLKDQRFTRYYFIIAPFHIFYVFLFAVLGQFGFFKWAEKNAEHGIVEQ